jgi:hypothetical protein
MKEIIITIFILGWSASSFGSWSLSSGQVTSVVSHNGSCN